jgi:hypothetical protein
LAPVLLSIVLYERNILFDAISGHIVSLFASVTFIACAIVAIRMLFLRPTPAWVVTAILAGSALIQVFSVNVVVLFHCLPSLLLSVASMIEPGGEPDDV